VQTAAASWQHLLLLLPVRWVRLQHKQMYIMVVACLGYRHPCPCSAAQAVDEVAHVFLTPHLIGCAQHQLLAAAQRGHDVVVLCCLA
jgi:hypothetical protein